MPKFSSRSKHELQSCCLDLQELFKEVVKHYDCTIIQGYRGAEEQARYFASGKSTLEYPNSKHNKRPSRAVDVAPYPINWTDKNRFYHFAGYVQAVADTMGLKIRWGGDWDGDKDFSDQSFDDLVHFEVN